MEKARDVVLFGATGFTGRQAVRYFAENVGSNGLNWAIAGRSRDGLERVRDGLGPGFEHVELITADSRDNGSIQHMVSRSRVVLNTAGPFALHGEPVVSACIGHGVDYVDITGETAYVRDLIDRYHGLAREKAVKIVPFCGFDSVPADIGTLMLVDFMHRELGQDCAQVRGFYSARGGLNGGTVASFLNMFETGQLARVRDPFLLNPHRGPGTNGSVNGQADPALPHYDKDLNGWAAPFFMAPVNSRVVRRSHALLSEWGKGYGPAFTYQEYTKVGGALPWMKAAGISAGLGLFANLCRNSAGRALLRKLAPMPGEGPSQETMDSGFFRLLLIGTTEDGRKVRATVKDSGDPGNRVTVKILCEAALCLALQRQELPGGEKRGGILTPATGLGSVLAKRLEKTGMQLTVEAL